MARFLLGRLLGAALVVFLVAVAAYGGLRLLRPTLYPGEAFWSGLRGDLEGIFLRLDLGTSCLQQGCRPVRTVLAAGAAGDLWLLAGTLVLGVGGGVLGGIWCASRPRARSARLLEGIATLLYSTPVMFFALGLLLLFNPIFGKLPLPLFFAADPGSAQPWSAPWAWLQTYLVPWIVTAAPLGAMCLRITLGNTLEELERDHVRTAVAKGLGHLRVVGRHASPPSHAGTAAFVGASVPLIVTNMVIVEHVFSVPGFFRHTWRASGHVSSPFDRYIVDWELLQAIALWAAVLVVAVSLLADLVLARIDPRVRSGRAG